jgi:DNA polymerase III subunit epsilon
MGLLGWLFGRKAPESGPSASVRSGRRLEIGVPARYPRPQDRVAAKQWARDLLSRRDWVIVDTDTTGLTKSSQVVAVGVMAHDGRMLLEAMARPKGRIPQTVAIHSAILPHELAAAPEFPELHERLMQSIAGKRVLAYNAAFHRRMLGQTAERYGLPWPPGWWEDVSEQWAAFVGEPYGDSGSYKRQERPGIRNRGAAQDCENTIALIRAMAESTI